VEWAALTGFEGNLTQKSLHLLRKEIKMLSFITTTTVIAFAAGLVVGWNVLPQPQFVKNLWSKYVTGPSN
jgi:hypothetical protein